MTHVTTESCTLAITLLLTTVRLVEF